MDSKNCIAFDGVRFSGGWLLLEAPIMCKMSGLRWAKQLHGVLWHVHFCNHFGTVMSWGVELWLPTLVSVESMCACLVARYGLSDG